MRALLCAGAVMGLPVRAAAMAIVYEQSRHQTKHDHTHAMYMFLIVLLCVPAFVDVTRARTFIRVNA